MEPGLYFGIVHAVDKDKRLARVKFPDVNMISDWLPVMKNRPFIPDYDAVPQRTEPKSGGSGDASFEEHFHELIIKDWLPVVNQQVLVGYVNSKDPDGVVLGGIDPWQ